MSKERRKALRILFFMPSFLFAFMLFLSPTVALTQTQPVGGEQQGMKVFFYRGDELVAVERDIPGGGQMVEFTILELLKGPTEEEKAMGLTTEIPEGVKMYYTSRSNDGKEFGVNLSRELLVLKGNPKRAERALTQLERTIKEASGAEKVEITIASEAAGSPPEDAYTALEIGSVKKGGSSPLALVIALLAVLAAVLVITYFIYLPRRRKAVAARTSAASRIRGRRQGKGGRR